MDRITATQVFVTIAQRGSLTAAADALDMSRAMVSRYLAEMEDWVGARLFHRNTRRIGLTATGERVLRHSEELLALSQQLTQGAGSTDTQLSGLLRVACSHSLAQATLVGMVGRFLALHPQACIDLQTTERTVDLVEERIDLSIRISNTLDPSLIARPLGICRSVVCAAPSYLERQGRPQAVADLAQHNCLSYAYFGHNHWPFTQDGAAIEVAVRGNLCANNSTALLEATLAGVGISLQPWYAAAAHVARGTIEVLLPEAEPLPLGIHAVYTSKEHQSPLMRALLDFLVQEFAGCDMQLPQGLPQA
ncbi:LysR family transcriptional regulator [Comamonas sp. GB3 AK4-5]|uniref:LysR family transcriptional regulator n=1 Tax=Comamonas sp. GB3 AK4-5 TaxID=3231487 RepID=UPI00351E4F44